MGTQTHTGQGQIMAGQIGVTGYVLGKNLDGISHEESLTRPTPAGNSLNWIIGHIVDARNKLATALTGEPVFSPDRFAIYEGKSDSAYSPEAAIDFDELKGCCHTLGESLVETLSSMDDESLAQPAPFSVLDNPHETVGSLAAAFTFHDAYHAGQTGVLRRVCGKEGMLTPPDVGD